MTSHLIKMRFTVWLCQSATITHTICIRCGPHAQHPHVSASKSSPRSTPTSWLGERQYLYTPRTVDSKAVPPLREMLARPSDQAHPSSRARPGNRQPPGWRRLALALIFTGSVHRTALAYEGTRRRTLLHIERQRPPHADDHARLWHRRTRCTDRCTRHRFQEERFEILEGEIIGRIGRTRPDGYAPVRPSVSSRFSPDAPHTFAVEADEPARFITEFRPGMRLAEFFAQIFWLADHEQIDAKGRLQPLQAALLARAFPQEFFLSADDPSSAAVRFPSRIWPDLLSHLLPHQPP